MAFRPATTAHPPYTHGFALPRLVKLAYILKTMLPVIDYHSHPQVHSLRPYTLELLQPWVDQALKRNIKSLAFTDHDRYHEGVDFAVVNRLREKNPDLDILIGIELDNDPETSVAGWKWVEKHWDHLDFVLGSVHYLPGESKMFDQKDQSDQIHQRGVERAFEEYLEQLEKIIQRGLIDCLAHLDLIKIHGLHPVSYDSATFFTPVLELAKKHELATEISTAGWRKTVNEVYPNPLLLERAVDLGLPMTTASDAHAPEQLAENYERLEPIIRSVGPIRLVKFKRHRSELL
jgi:histidinol-phosphatase (PHP family)